MYFGYSHGLLFDRNVRDLDRSLDHLWLRNFHDHLDRIVDDAFLLLDNWYMDAFFLLMWHVDVNGLFDVEMMCSFLSLDVRDVDDSLLDHGHVNFYSVLCWDMHHFFLLHWHMNILDYFDRPMVNTFLLLYDWDMNDFLLLMRHVNIDMLLHMKMVRSFLALNSRYVDMNFPCHRHWHFDNLLNGSVMNALLLL